MIALPLSSKRPDPKTRRSGGFSAFFTAGALALVANGAGAAGSAAAAIDAGGPATRAPLAMMNMMMEMKPKAGGMAPSAPMQGGGAPAKGSQMPMPSSTDPMGNVRGSMKKPEMGSMTSASQLPGFPGASHLYHVGATGYFLDHPEHITLSMTQQTALNRIKERALLDQAGFGRRIEEAEQALWMLTAADAPEAAKIESQVRVIERLRGDQRLAFIRSVGEAGKVLTADQQGALLGTHIPPPSKPAAAKPAAPMAPMDHK